MSPDEYGIFALLIIIETIAGVFSRETVGPALFRSYYDYEDDKNRAMVVSTAFYLILLISGVVSSLGYIFASYISKLVIGDTTYGNLVRIIFINNLLGSVGVITFAVFRAKKWSKRYVVVSLLAFIVQLVSILYLVVVKKTGLWGIVIGRLVGTVVSASLTLPQIWKDLKLIISGLEIKKMLRYGLPFVPHGLLSMIINSADRIFLQRIASLTAAGLYSLGYKFGQIVSVVLIGPYNIIATVMVFSAEKDKDAKEFYSKLATYLLFSTLFFSLGISVLARDVIKIAAAASYHEAYKVVPLICLAFVLFGVRGPLGVGIALKRKTEYFPIADGASVVVNIPLMFALIPRYGSVGAAIALVAAYLMNCVVRYFAGRKFYPVDYEWGRMLKMTLCAFALYGISLMISFENIWLSISMKTLLAASFPLLLLVVRFYEDVEKYKIRELWARIHRRVFAGLRKL